MNRKPFLAEKAMAYVKEYMAQPENADATVLPSIRALAASAQVTYYAMRCALHTLHRQGRTKVIPFRGAVMPGRVGKARAKQTLVFKSPDRPSSPGTTRDNHPRKWSRLKEAITRDVLRGKFKETNSLPSIKELGILYGASYATMKKTLIGLCEGHIVQPFKKGYRIPTAEFKAFRPSLLFIVCTNSSHELYSASPRDKLFIDSIIMECTKADIAVHLYDFDENVPLALNKLTKFVEKRSTDIGYLVLPTWARRVSENFLRILGRKNRPCAIFFHEKPESVNPELMKNYTIRVFTIAAKAAGRHAGEFMLEKGHTSVAYISYQHSSAWSQQRLLGLSEIYVSAGYPDGICSFTDQALAGKYDFASNVLDLTRDQVRKLCEPAFSKEQLPEILEHYEKSKSADLFPALDAAVRKKVKDHYNLLLELAKSDIDRELYCGFRSTVNMYEADRLTRHFLEPLFEKALQNSSATAWVASNDDTALCAMKYLDRKGVRVPQDISVFGFDDTHEAFINNLTSYNFDIPAIAYGILAFILKPKLTLEMTKESTIETRGVIVQRASTAQARK
jgi:DNA-binding LacI/PurR family transcriptional regulator/DNA-binding transcriptional regulator YhcF (GntR family)